MSKPQTAPTSDIILRLVREHGRAYAPKYAVAFVFMGVVAACTAITAWLMKDVINTIFVDQSARAMLFFPAIVCGIFVTKGIFAYFQEVTLTKIGRQIIAELQKRVYDHLLRMDLDFFRRRPSAVLVTKLNHGAMAARNIINLVAVSLGRDLLTLVGLCVVMILQDPLMFAMTLVTVPFAALTFRKLTARAKKAARSETQSMATIVALTRETAQGAKMIKSFQLEGMMREKMYAAIHTVERLANKIVRVRAIVDPLSEALAGLAIGAVILYGTLRASSDPEMPGRFFSFLTALLLAGNPIRRLSRLHVNLATASVPVSMMYELLDEPEREPDDETKPELNVHSGEVRFENISFAYPSGPKVLNDLDLIFEAGKTTALVGPSGVGKTTVFNLIQGFYRPTRGCILIDGTSIADVSLKSLRRHVAFLDQEAFLFEGSIEENITGAVVTANGERARAAGGFANADEFIRRMKKGYASPVGELGANLSGGQRQRIAVARAFYKDAPILLLDEPTSALDAHSEQKLMDSIRRLAKGRTTIIIAHRMSTALHADRIYVIEGGRAVESGTHAQLLEQSGPYARLHNVQLSEQRS